MDFREFLKNNFVIFDGAMGTMLQASGLKVGELPETYNILRPEAVKNIHELYVKAGADVITTNTFQANELKLKDSGYSPEEIISAGVKIAKEAGASYIALDIGPLGQLMRPMGIISFEEAYEIFRRQVVAGVTAGADIILIETISDLYEAKAAILAAKENCNLPVLCTMTFQEDGRTFIGTDPKTAVIVLQGLGVDALGINCSMGPEEILSLVKEVLKYSRVPVMIQPNAGIPEFKHGNTIYNIAPEKFGEYIRIMAENGVRVLGGCCGTTPKYIKEIQKVLSSLKPVVTTPKVITAAASFSNTVEFDNRITIVGERLNPTGKRRLKEALKNEDMDYIVSEAISQIENGAEVLDVNVGLPEIDEVETMKKVVTELQGYISYPLQIDSVEANVIEAAVRIYNGKPIINSVNGKPKSMKTIFPIAKKYGALVIGLALDENGIPTTADERYNIAKKIINEAEKFGIGREDVIIDCLTLTASAQQKEVMETIKAITLIKEKLGVKTVLGVSNVSFGLPERELLNATFLAAALGAGLNAPIINPGSKPIMDVINAFKVLNNEDSEAKSFIMRYGNVERVEHTEEKSNINLKSIIIDGRKVEAALITSELLKEKDPLKIVDEYFIPALDQIGERYEKGTIFLPQLIQSAEAVKKGFEVIKQNYEYKNFKGVSRGKILLATVKGDIHDIGKNIVKMMLENYGFEIIDLGKDVPVNEIVKTVKDKEIRLIGLSALMTTTVKNMEATIEALRDDHLNCSVMVGGAVLNSEYAKMIGADFYARDARECVKIATEFFKLT